MEQLIVMKQRIKAVETIKKVTHAMRLISMSSHTKLQEKRKNLIKYRDTFKTLWTSVQGILPPIEKRATSGKHLVIVVGSQKGLCGTFNTGLFKFFEKNLPAKRRDLHVIGVGLYAVDYLTRKKVPQRASYKKFSANQFVAIAQSITDLIIDGPFVYDTVTIFSNKQKTFFVQQPHATLVYPQEEPEEPAGPQEYIFEQSPKKLRDTLNTLLILVTIQDLLFESLVSEQAARFISMDSSTRNAENLLTSMKRSYNKVRQAGITRELTELSATLT